MLSVYWERKRLEKREEEVTKAAHFDVCHQFTRNGMGIDGM